MIQPLLHHAGYRLSSNLASDGTVNGPQLSDTCDVALGANHPRHYLGHSDRWTPAENLCRLCGISHRVT